MLLAESSTTLGPIEVKGCKYDVDLLNVETSVGNIGASKKVGNDKASEKISAGPGSLGVGANLGAWGFAVKVNLNKTADAFGNWMSAVGSNIKVVEQEASDSFFVPHGKSQ